MTIRLYLDEDSMQRALVAALRVRRIDVLTAIEAGMIARPDEEHLDFAGSQKRVLYSFNVSDFSRLHGEFVATGRFHAGIVLARQQHYSVGEQMRRLLRLIANRTAAEMEMQIEFLSAW
jgi:hypothetical protein